MMKKLFSLSMVVSAFVVFAVLPAYSAQNKNLLYNSGFELGKKGWFIGSTSTWGWDGEITSEIVREGSHTGVKCLVVGCDGDRIPNVTVKSDLLPLEAGKTYFFSVYLKTDMPVQKVCLSINNSLRGSGNTIRQQTVDVNKEWKRYFFSFSIPEAFPKENYIEISLEGSDFFKKDETRTHSRLWIDSVKIEEGGLTDYSAIEGTDFSVTTTKIGNIFFVQEPIVLNLTVENNTSNSEKAKVNYQINDYWGKEVLFGEESLNISRYGIIEKPLKLTLKKGYYEALFSLTTNEGMTKTEKVYFGILDYPPISGDPSSSRFGMHIAAVGDIKYLADIIGLKWFRSGVGLERLLSNRTSWDWQVLERINKFGEESGIRFELACPIKSNVWWSKKDLEHYTSEVYLNLWAEIAGRYKDMVGAFEPVQEVYGEMLAKDFVHVLKGAYVNIKKGNPEAIVLANVAEFKNFKYVESFFKNGGYEFCDGISVHPYCTLSSSSPEQVEFEEIFHYIRQMNEQYCPGKRLPIWVTEHNVIQWGVSERQAADYMARVHIIAFAEGVEKYFWHLMGGNYPSHHYIYDLLRKDNSPTPSYIAYANLKRVLSGITTIGEIPIREDIRAYLFKKGEKWLIPIWRINEKGVEEIIVNLPEENLIGTDLMGNSIKIEKKLDGVILPLGSPPTFWEIKAESKDSIIKAFKEANFIKAEQ